MKTTQNATFRTVTAASKSRWPHGRKARCFVVITCWLRGTAEAPYSRTRRRETRWTRLPPKPSVFLWFSLPAAPVCAWSPLANSGSARSCSGGWWPISVTWTLRTTEISEKSNTLRGKGGASVVILVDCSPISDITSRPLSEPQIEANFSISKELEVPTL